MGQYIEIYRHRFVFYSVKHCPGDFFSLTCTCVRKCYIFAPQPQTAPDVTASIVDFTMLSHGFTIDGIFSLFLSLTHSIDLNTHTFRVLYRFHVRVTLTAPGVWIPIYIHSTFETSIKRLCSMCRRNHEQKTRQHWPKEGKKIQCKCLSKSAKRTIKSTNLRHLLKQKPLHQFHLFSFLLLRRHLCTLQLLCSSCFILILIFASLTSMRYAAVFSRIPSKCRMNFICRQLHVKIPMCIANCYVYKLKLFFYPHSYSNTAL